MIGTYGHNQDLNNKIRLAYLDAVKSIKQASPNDYEFRFYLLRKLCLDLSNLMNKVPSASNLDYQGMSDNLYFYSVTFHYFTNYNYTSVTSHELAIVRKCDIPNPAKYFNESTQRLVIIPFNHFLGAPTPEEDAQVIKTDTKTYSSSYIWAQLTIWWKQTVQKIMPTQPYV